MTNMSVPLGEISMTYSFIVKDGSFFVALSNFPPGNGQIRGERFFAPGYYSGGVPEVMPAEIRSAPRKTNVFILPPFNFRVLRLLN